MNNRELITQEFLNHKGEFVLDDFKHKVCRFVGLIEDSFDYYYVLFDGRDFSLQTCVGRLIYLKNKIDDEDYQYLTRSAKMNHDDYICNKYPDVTIYNDFRKKKEEFLIRDQEQDNTNNSDLGNNKLILPLHWDID